LNSKRILVVACALCLLMSAAIGVCAAAFTRHFDALERERAATLLQQHLHVLGAHVAQLAERARSYAQAAHIDASATSHSPLDWQVDVLAVVDARGRELQAQQVNPMGRGVMPLSTGLLAQLLQLWSEQRPLGTGFRCGWLNTERGLLAVCALAVGLESQPPKLVVLGRYFAAGERPAFDLVPLGTPARSTELAPEVAAWLYRAAPATSLVVDDPSSRSSRAHAVLRDVAGRNVTLVRATTSGKISANGRRTTWLMMGTLGLVLGAASFVLLLLILREQPSSAHDAARNHDALRELQESVALIDVRAGAVLEANDTWLRVLDYERAELAALSLRGIYLDLPDELHTVESGAPIECRMRARDGRLIDAELTLAEITANGQSLFAIVGRDISQRKQAEQSLADSVSLFEHLCTHDALTELPNRTYLQTHLPSLLQEVADTGRVLGLLYCDLDWFEQRDQLPGHGDAPLRLIAARLRSELPAQQLLVRMESDEFVVVVAAQALREIDALANQLLDWIRKPLTFEAGSVALTANIGIAAYPQHGLDGDTLLKHADIALYRAKQQAGHSCCWFGEDVNLQESERVILEQSLRRAINTDQIQLEYQPIVDLDTGLVSSFEALARWRHPQLGTVPPERFIPVAEHSRLIVPLGEQILRMAILQLHDWQAAGLPLVPVAINVTALQLELAELAAYVDELVRRYQVDLKWLAFEVTESVWLQDPCKQLTTLQQLRSAGSRIYMDDCNARLPDPERLRLLPVDAIKLDQNAIRAELEGTDTARVLAQTIALAEQLNLTTVAEGIETAAQAEQLRELGCRCGQGYYFSKPIPPLQCRSLLQHMGEARRMTETVKNRALRINRAAATAE
jgi:diguanylate cyclase (GGDEF)-like protein/PAS domain S-box-containing protein